MMKINGQLPSARAEEHDFHYENLQDHSDDIQDIISAAPSWLIRWGIVIFFSIMLLIFGLSTLLRYPDLVKTRLKINSTNSPKAVITKKSGKIIKILVREGQWLEVGQPLAYLESTAIHEQVLNLLESLKKLQAQLYKGDITDVKFLDNPVDLQLGEVQQVYQGFFQSYLNYKSSVSEGLYLRKRKYLQKDLEAINEQKKQLQFQKKLQEQEYAIAKEEYAIQQKLAEQKVVAQMELKREESKLLSKRYPLQQTETAFISNSTSHTAKQKEIMELDNQIKEERKKFIQALNSLISEVESWKSNYILSFSQQGKVAFAAIVQENQFVDAGEEIFYVSSGNTDFFGEMEIPQYNMGKIKEGQEVLIKLKSYPYEEYGLIKGKINFISDIPFRDSVFISKVNLNKGSFSELRRPLKLKNGMLGDAEIITEDASLFNRVARNIIKMLN